jgi:hypothetical protein
VSTVLGSSSRRPTRRTTSLLAGFLQALKELGYVEGQTLAIEFRSAEGRMERLPGLAAELVGLPIDVIVTAETAATRAGREMDDEAACSERSAGGRAVPCCIDPDGTRSPFASQTPSTRAG